ncbi:hypothetical protein BASA83_002087 [Batrachochytrium salamandrivorans]|nr:hypothetical protein BASA83_002087 [Batrachochytrium salamandrivorans]
MISLYGLFILLLTAEAIHAQGNTNEGDDANQASGSNPSPKKAGLLALKVYPINLSGFLRKTKAPDQNGASSSVDTKPKKVCKGLRWLRNLFKSCARQQSPPEPQPSTSHDPPQPDKMPLPDYVGKAEAESYLQSQNPEQYDAFTKSEAKYFKSKYVVKKELGKGDFGTVYLATQKSNGMKVAYKSIIKSKVENYALELSPPPRCYTLNPLSRHKKLAATQCMSPRPPNLYVPHEVLLHMYLSRPGNENVYVPRAFDYITLKNEFMLIMDYMNEEWVSLLSYLEEKRRLGVSEARNILRKVINAAINLKQHGVFHNDIHTGNVMYDPKTGEIKLIDFGMSIIRPGWKEGAFSPLKRLDPSSTALKYEAGSGELKGIQKIGQLLSNLLTGIRLYKDDFKYGTLIRKAILPDPDPLQSELKERAIDLVNILVSRDPKQMSSIEAILDHSFFRLNNKE